MMTHQTPAISRAKFHLPEAGATAIVRSTKP